MNFLSFISRNSHLIKEFKVFELFLVIFEFIKIYLNFYVIHNIKIYNKYNFYLLVIFDSL